MTIPKSSVNFKSMQIKKIKTITINGLDLLKAMENAKTPLNPLQKMDNDDVQSLVSEIIHTLQYDYGYLKPQPKSTAGNIQGDGIYNWEAHNVLENLIKERYNVEEEE